MSTRLSTRESARMSCAHVYGACPVCACLRACGRACGRAGGVHGFDKRATCPSHMSTHVSTHVSTRRSTGTLHACPPVSRARPRRRALLIDRKHRCPRPAKQSAARSGTSGSALSEVSASLRTMWYVARMPAARTQGTCGVYRQASRHVYTYIGLDCIGNNCIGHN